MSHLTSSLRVDAQVMRFANLTFEPRSGELRRNGAPLRLEGQPLQVLAALLERPGEIVTREELRARLWSDGVFLDFGSGLNSAVNRLRAVLGDSATHPRFVETVGRRGYRFVARVAATLGTTATAISTIAVLPLASLSGAEESYVADGMTEALIAALAQIGAVRVISCTSSMRFKGTRRSLPDVARELKADAVVEGSVLRAEGRLRVIVRLVDARSDSHLWARTYERDAREMLGLQSEVACDVADALRLGVTPGERARLARHRSADPAVQDACFRGRHCWNKRTEGGLRAAIAHFRSAIDLDPLYAPAYAGLADCHNSLSTVPLGQPPREHRPLAAAAAARALELDPGLPEAHGSLAYARLYDWDWSAAEEGFRRAIELKPSYAEAHAWYAHYLCTQARLDEALAEAGVAQQLDPLSIYVRTTVGYVLHVARRYSEAEAQYRRALELEPDSGLVLLFAGFNLLQQGRGPEAVATLETAMAVWAGAPALTGWLVQAHAISGRSDRAHELLEELRRVASCRYVPPSSLAMAAFGVGRIDEGFAQLEAAFEERANVMAYLAVIPAFEPLRGDPRFQSLLERTGLAAVVAAG